MNHAAATLLALLVVTIGAAQETTEPARPPGPTAATEARPTRDTATETGPPTWVDPLRAGTLTTGPLALGPIPCG